MPSGARERGGASTKGDHHVATAYADDRGHDPGRVGCWNAAALRPDGLPIGGALSPFPGPAQRGGSTSLPAGLRQNGAARGTFKISQYGLRFLYHHTLGRGWGLFGEKTRPVKFTGNRPGA